MIGRPDDRVHAEHQPAGHERGAGDVRALAEADTLVMLEQARGQYCRGDPDRQVDEEDPVPVERLGEHPAGEQSDRRARGRDEAVDPDRLGLLARLAEQRHDHAERDGRGQRAADTLDESRHDQHLARRGHAARQRREGEHRQAEQEDPFAADQVTDATGKQEQAAERDQVGIDDPGEARLREAEIVLDRRQGDVHDCLVEDDHQEAGAQHDERQPAGRSDRCGGSRLQAHVA